MIGGVLTGAVVEDGQLVTSGALTVTNPDGNPGFKAVIAGLTGTYGTFTFNNANGAWNYTLANSASNVHALNAGQKVYDMLTVTTLDNVQGVITVEITGNADQVNLSVLFEVDRGQAVVNGSLVISNDKLDLLGQVKYAGSFSLIDYQSADGVKESTQVFIETENDSGSVILVGYTNFDPAIQII